MKPAQWTAVIVLALMVGGLSFIRVYLGGNSSDPVALPATDTLASLSFPIKVFPQGGEMVQTTEVGQRGRQDFWFVNDSGQEVTVGLSKKGCTCSEVEIALAPAPWPPYLLASAITPALQQPLRGWDNLTTLIAANQSEQLFPDLPTSDALTLTLENSKTVPAGAIGWIRLSWRQESAKPLLTFAELWMGERGGSVGARLETSVRISTTMEVKKEISIATVGQRDLEQMPQGQRADIYCWSLTRPSFQLKAELVTERFQRQSDPVEVGEPIPLSPAELRRLQQSEGLHRMTILSGYRVPVTVRAKAKDGTPIQWGPFRRFVQLSSDSPGVEQVQVQVTGEVVGDVTVGGGKWNARLDLGPFPRTRGARGNIVLQTDEKNLDLELDASRVPPYLRASLDKPKESVAGHRSWLLHVEVPPNAARGEFPRGDNPVYHDSAIYVKTKEKPPRSIRVPVIGTANDG